MTEDRILTLTEAARLLGRSKRNVHLLQEQGALPRVSPPGLKRGRGIPHSAVLAFIQACTRVSPSTGKAVAP